MSPHPDLASLELGELEHELEARGIPRFHARQLYRWIFKRGVTDFDLMTDLAKSFRERLKEIAEIRTPQIRMTQVSSDGTRKWLLAMGIAATVLFVGLRASNIYGDPRPWNDKATFVEIQNSRAAAGELGPNPSTESPQLSEPEFTILSFLNTAKYPPSLLFLLMTLGPGLIILAFTDGISGQPVWQKIGIVFGRVPLFFYLLQWVSAHFFGIGLSLLYKKDIGYLFESIGPGMQVPPDNGFSLPVVYFAWIAGLILIFPLCYWYGNFKQRNRHWMLSYL